MPKRVSPLLVAKLETALSAKVLNPEAPVRTTTDDSEAPRVQGSEPTAQQSAAETQLTSESLSYAGACGSPDVGATAPQPRWIPQHRRQTCRKRKATCL